MRIAYFGSGDFGVFPLRYLCEHEDVRLVFTTPDVRRGRGLRLMPPPVKEAAEKLGKCVIQPHTLKDNKEVVALLKEYDIELAVVVDYGKIIPEFIYSTPKYQTVNLHPSLLPKYRGAAPIRWAIINGESKTGNTVFFIERKLDAGDIILQEEEPIYDDDTYGTLSERLSARGAILLHKAIKFIESGIYDRLKQDERLATYAPKISSKDMVIRWSKMSAEAIERWVRAMNPSPGMFTYWNDKRVKIWSVNVVKCDRGNSSEIVDIGDSGPIVRTLEGCVEVVSLQFEGKRVISGKDFINGYKVSAGDRFGAGGEEG